MNQFHDPGPFVGYPPLAPSFPPGPGNFEAPSNSTGDLEDGIRQVLIDQHNQFGGFHNSPAMWNPSSNVLTGGLDNNDLSAFMDIPDPFFINVDMPFDIWGPDGGFLDHGDSMALDENLSDFLANMNDNNMALDDGLTGRLDNNDLDLDLLGPVIAFNAAHGAGLVT